ncbi:MAG: thioredoxin family protein [Rhodothermus sp.]|nr:thioredoxin family protein [Rhodothermus sp.]
MRRVVAIVLGGLLTVTAWAQLPLADRPMPSVDGQQVTLAQLRGSRGLVIVFWSNRCPWADRYEARVKKLAEMYKVRGVAFVLVNANDPKAFPQESLEASRRQAQRRGYTIPYLQDRGAALARALGASRTPEVFVFDAHNRLIYRGAIDDSPGDATNAQRTYLQIALEALLQGKAPPTTETGAFGCLIRFPQDRP